MTILLQSEHAGKRQNLVIRPGQLALVGSSSWADLAIDYDSSMAPEHFRVEHMEEPIVRCLGDAGLECNGERFESIAVENGIRFNAGTTSFEVKYSKTAKKDIRPSAAGQDDAEVTDAPVILAETIVRKLKLLPATIKLLSGEPVALRELLATAQSVKLAGDFIKIAATVLTASEALTLVTVVLEQFGATLDAKEAIAVEGWRNSLQEDARTEVEQLARLANRRGSVFWLLQAISWTGGSLGPKDAAVVAPPEHLFAYGLAVAIQIAIAQSDGMVPTSPWVRLAEVVTHCLSEDELAQLVQVKELNSEEVPHSQVRK